MSSLFKEWLPAGGVFPRPQVSDSRGLELSPWLPGQGIWLPLVECQPPSTAVGRNNSGASNAFGGEDPVINACVCGT